MPPAADKDNAVNDSSPDLDRIENDLVDDVSDETLEAAGMGLSPRALPCTAAPFLGPTFGAGYC
jgi:hypothetical protein